MIISSFSHYGSPLVTLPPQPPSFIQFFLKFTTHLCLLFPLTPILYLFLFRLYPTPPCIPIPYCYLLTFFSFLLIHFSVGNWTVSSYINLYGIPSGSSVAYVLEHLSSLYHRTPSLLFYLMITLCLLIFGILIRIPSMVGILMFPLYIHSPLPLIRILFCLLLPLPPFIFDHPPTFLLKVKVLL